MGFLFGFRGRFGRLQWWSVQLLTIIAYVGFLAFFGTITGIDLNDVNSEDNGGTLSKFNAANIVLIVAFVALMCWMFITASIKRYHDRNKPGWWYLVCIIPIVGPIWQIIELGFLRGTDGPNDFDVDGEKSAPYVSKPATQTITVAAAPARRIETATARTSFGQKPGFGTRRT